MNSANKNQNEVSPQRHANMAAIHGKDTKPELIVRKFLWSNGFRYRLNHPRLPGHPDVVLRRYRTCVFVNGCFWHGHEGCRFFVIPKSNVAFWERKIMRNRERDIKVQQQLAAMGWHCITVWECELKPSCREQTLQSLLQTLNHIFLADRRPGKYYVATEQPEPLVAEEITSYEKSKKQNKYETN